MASIIASIIGSRIFFVRSAVRFVIDLRRELGTRMRSAMQRPERTLPLSTVALWCGSYYRASILTLHVISQFAAQASFWLQMSRLLPKRFSVRWFLPVTSSSSIRICPELPRKSGNSRKSRCKQMPSLQMAEYSTICTHRAAKGCVSSNTRLTQIQKGGMECRHVSNCSFWFKMSRLVPKCLRCWMNFHVDDIDSSSIHSLCAMIACCAFRMLKFWRLPRTNQASKIEFKTRSSDGQPPGHEHFWTCE